MHPDPPPKKKLFSRKPIIWLIAIVILVYAVGDLFLPFETGFAFVRSGGNGAA